MAMFILRTTLILLVALNYDCIAAPHGNSLLFQSEETNSQSPSIFGKISNLFHHQVSRLATSSGSFFECQGCKLVVDILQTAVKENSSHQYIKEKATSACKLLHVETEQVCQGMANMFAPEVLTVLKKLPITPSQMCAVVLGDSCGEPYKPFDDWNVTLTNVSQPKPVEPVLPKKDAPSYRVLHLTDVHFDALYKAGSNAKCKEPLCCRAQSGDVDSPSDAAWKFGDYRSCDTPLQTLENLFSSLAAENDTFDYIYWTGDLPAHDIWEQPRDTQLASLHRIIDMIHKYFPGKPVYPSLGNHESSPVNSFPPNYIKGNDSIGWLYNSLADSWKQWLPASALDTVRRGAYYTVSPHKGFRIISLNMNYCNNQNWWLLLNTTDPNQELRWLIDTLQAAENMGEKVHIIGHIPPGISDCLKGWSWNYYQVVSRYQNTITGQFFGHTHYDSFEVFYDVETLTRPVSVAYVAPSVTPYSGLNIGYRFYTVDGKYPGSSFQVLDHSTYILDLDRANREGKITWELEYSAKSAYNMSSLFPRDWDKVIQVMKNDDSTLKMFNKFYHKSVDSGDCDSDCRHARLCEVRSGRSHDPSLCRDIGITHERHYRHVMGKTPKHC